MPVPLPERDPAIEHHMAVILPADQLAVLIPAENEAVFRSPFLASHIGVIQPLRFDPTVEQGIALAAWQVTPEAGAEVIHILFTIYLFAVSHSSTRRIESRREALSLSLPLEHRPAIKPVVYILGWTGRGQSVRH